MTDYAAVLTALYSDVPWAIGEDYDSLEWFADAPKPTKKKLDDAWPQIQHQLEVARIKAERETRYRAETDPLFFRFQRNEDGVTLADWQAAVQQIRDDLPYPEAPS